MHNYSQKQKIREYSIQRRASIPSQDKTQANAQIMTTLLHYIQSLNRMNICIYLSLPDEVDTWPLLSYCKQKKKVLIIPKIEELDLHLYRIQSPDDLEEGTFHLWQPKQTCSQYLPQDVDIFIVPGVAFDPFGHRLGWGKGYYDKLLSTVTAYKIGLGYSQQIFPLLPQEAYDIVMDVVITEREVYENQGNNQKNSR